MEGNTMPLGDDGLVQAKRADTFSRLMEMGRPSWSIAQRDPARLNLDQESVKNGLGQLVLTLVKLLHELLERQAIRRMESGSLTDAEIESLGMTMMMQAQEIDRLRREFGLEENDLNLDLGPLGKLL
jgi:hypothetical protein